MAPSDSTKVALGVLVFAGIGLTLYFLSKQLRKKKKSNGSTSTSAQKSTAHQDVPPTGPEEQVSPDRREHPDAEPQETFSSSSAQTDDTVPKALWDTHSVFQRKNQQKETEQSSSTTTTKDEDEGEQEETTLPECETTTDSFTSQDTTAVSMSTSSWEDVKPLSESFTDVKSSSVGADVSQGAGGDSVMSQMGQDSLGSFTPLDFDSKGSAEEASKLESKDDQTGSGDSCSAADSKQQPETGSEEFVTVPSNGLKESSLDDTMSSNGEALSFVKVDDRDEAAPVAGSGASAGMNNPPIIRFQQPSSEQEEYEESSVKESSSTKEDPNADSLPSFERISETEGASFEALSSLREEDSAADSLSSYERISETDGASFVAPSQSTTSSAPEAAEENGQSRQSSQVEEQLQATENPQTEAAPPVASEGISSPPSQSRSAGASEADSTESSGSFEMVKRGLGASREEFYSSESLQSFATATSSAGSNLQDFYSPIASPTQVDSSMDNLSFRSFDDSASLDADTSEELTFYDVEGSSGRVQTPPASPIDRTPTNSPVAREVSGEDDPLSVIESQDDAMSSSLMEESLVADTEGNQNLSEGKEADEQQAQLASPPAAASSANTVSWKESEKLVIDKDKMADAILQAQTNPDHLEIGQLQILVELLKQDDWALLNTACESIIRASAFTINVNILCVCQGPAVLAGVLERFAPLLTTSGEQPSSQGQGDRAADAEKIFLNVARAVNNLAMDIKSQKQLESTIPVLTDLLMTEGISETVTLASLQPLTNMSASGSKSYQGHYTRLLQQLYSFLDTSQSPSLRLQCVKLLVNLSLNADMVPHMLAAKAPSCLLDMLDINYDIDLLLRTVTFLANVMTIMQDRELSPSNLPPDEKAPSPETLYSALSALDRRDALRNKIFRLTRHSSEDVSYQASRLYKFIVASK